MTLLMIGQFHFLAKGSESRIDRQMTIPWQRNDDRVIFVSTACDRNPIHMSQSAALRSRYSLPVGLHSHIIFKK